MSITINTLDSTQILQQIYDPSTGGIKTTPASATSFSIELSADDGDSVISRGESSSLTGSLTASSTGALVAAASCVGMKNFTLYSKTTATITTPPTLTVEVSPSDSLDVWYPTSTTLVPSLTLNTVLASSVGTMVARRIRVSTSAATASGTADLFLVTH